MSFLQNLFNKKEKPIESYDDFWNWFKQNEKAFHQAVKVRENIENTFFNKLSAKLDQICQPLYYVTGMHDEDTVELIITPEGIVKNIVFVEELIAAAPDIKGWKFTPLKPALDIQDISIEMNGYKFNADNIFFYPNELPEYPDEIDVTIIHNDYNEEEKNTIVNGTYIFLDNYLGELSLVTSVDNIQFIEKNNAKKELIPISKLKDYLKWRQAEFLEKYEGVRHNTNDDNYSVLEAELQNGKSLIAVVNSDLLNWDKKASHPWVLIVTVKYDGSANNGMPGDNVLPVLDNIENSILSELKDEDGYLNIGRETADSVREIYFACKDFRKPSKVVRKVLDEYSSSFETSFDIYKDKYWRSYNRFNPIP